MELFSIDQLATALGISARAVRYRITQGDITAKRVGRDWVIEADEFAKVKAAAPPKRGRPRGRAVAAVGAAQAGKEEGAA